MTYRSFQSHIAVPLVVFVCAFMHSRIALSAPIKLTSTDGKTIEAELKSIGEGDIEIEMRGKAMRLPLERLSDETRERLKPEHWALGYDEEKTPVLIPRPKETPAAGTNIHIDMPELGKTLSRGDPARFQLIVGKNYDPMKPAPLFLWFGQGSGSDSDFWNRRPLLGDRVEDFVCAFLPYPHSYENMSNYNDSLRSGAVEAVETYHEAMLEKLGSMFPNLDPRLGIAGGFSNGAHTIATHLGNDFQPFVSRTNCYILIEGGSFEKERFPRHKGDSMVLAFGDKYERYSLSGYLKSAVKRAGFDYEWIEMPGVGHEFPDQYQKQVSKHITDVMIPRHLEVKDDR